MSTNNSDIERFQTAVAASLHAHWVLFLIEGIVLVVLGMAAIVLPPLATFAVAILIGWLLLVSGIVGLVTTFWMRHAPGFWWSLFSAVLAVAAGFVLLRWPLSAVLSLTLVLTVFLLLEGVASIMYALEHRRELSGRWGMMLVSGDFGGEQVRTGYVCVDPFGQPMRPERWSDLCRGHSDAVRCRFCRCIARGTAR